MDNSNLIHSAVKPNIKITKPVFNTAKYLRNGGILVLVVSVPAAGVESSSWASVILHCFWITELATLAGEYHAASPERHKQMPGLNCALPVTHRLPTCNWPLLIRHFCPK